ncbi:MBL fold metallo-hydrolase [Candidatus Hecatella orcuttiae]|jgi:L-ascorbate metabolism protein UlaG (beta-lactamase superfamily)|uniref:MBL fold metallo-hydrolase n=1 Tax=Candidatus Hecatella orcuttiae TaxID=1935119 RepID=UPI002867F221|nr:MBL fold metallo-hydrolase [Candidatus Hecatella orcuttiae]
MLEYKGLKISWLGHAGFKITDGKTIYIDPYQIKGEGEADLLLITHEHFDHLSLEDIKKIASEKTVVITTPMAEPQLAKLKVKEVKTVKPGDRVDVEGVTVEAVPAYNLDKFRSPGRVFHPKEDGKVGFVLTFQGAKIYHAGDTDAVPEMKDIQPDIALLPVSGTYVMTAVEAAEAVKLLKPKLAVPMHYGSIVGDEEDAKKFKETASCDVQILSKE